MIQSPHLSEPSRRAVVVGAAAIAIAGGGSALAAPGGGASEATGLVTEVGAGPLADVLVSNGREVTRTGADGRWRLPVAPGQAIFAIKPSGFAAPVAPGTNLPRVSYVHDPDGTPTAPAFRYAGLPATGPLPASIDFAFTRSPEPTRFDVVLLTDPQPESAAEIGYLRDDIVAPLLAPGRTAAFAMVLGDLAFDDLAAYPRLARMFGRVGVPWWPIGGNHDLDYEAADARRSRDTWKRVFGAPYFAHYYGGVLFVMLDNVDYLGAGTGKNGEHGAYRGHISADQLAFVEALLAQTPAETLLVFGMHIPLRCYFDPTMAAANTDNAAALLALIGDRPCVSFAGHTHTTEHHYLGGRDGGSDAHPHHHHVLTAASGSWWSGPLDHRGIACADQTDGTPNGFHVLGIDGARYTTRFVPAAEPADRQMRIVLETGYHARDKEVLRTTTMAQALRSPITVDEVSGARLLVNLFDGGPRSTVRFALEDGPSIAMEREARPDPFVEQLYGRHSDTIKTWVKPSASSHLWQAALPSRLAAGTYRVRVAATDEYGRIHEDGMILEVV